MQIMSNRKPTGLTARFVSPDSFFSDWMEEIKTISVENAGSIEWRLFGVHRRFGKCVARWAPQSMVGGGVGSMVVCATQY